VLEHLQESSRYLQRCLWHLSLEQFGESASPIAAPIMYLRYIVLTLAMSLVNSVFPGYSEGHDNDESSLYAKTKDPFGAIFAPLRTVVNDDVNDSRVQVSVCKNAIFTNCPIATGKNVHLNETVACLLQTLDYLDEEGTCAMVFSSIINNDRIYYLEPLDDITCFAQNYFTRTDDCRIELDELIGNIIPCADEARKYCPGDVAGTMPCLNATYSNSSGIFSTGCIGLISTWSYTTNLESLETEGDISDDYDTRDFIYFEDSTQWSRVLKGDLILYPILCNLILHS
jgi:hypothetical protein